jgi:casein kinase II subunit beta
MQLYGLIHARYIITTHGLDSMHTKFLNGDFGKCPRTLCKGQKVVPVRNSKVGTTLHLYI